VEINAAGRGLSAEAAERAGYGVPLHLYFLHTRLEGLDLCGRGSQLRLQPGFLADFRFQHVLGLGILVEVSGCLVFQGSNMGPRLGELGIPRPDLLLRSPAFPAQLVCRFAELEQFQFTATFLFGRCGGILSGRKPCHQGAAKQRRQAGCCQDDHQLV
jgi:hypothetical protein